MALSAALRRPDFYAGVAAFMPFIGFSPGLPPDLVGTRLRHVLFAYSLGDPGLPAEYPARVLSPFAQACAQALGFSDAELSSSGVLPLPDLVEEGQGLADDTGTVQVTRDSRSNKST